jgi:hypothetical protein
VTLLIIASLVTLGALCACLRRAPLLTVLCVGLLGWAVQTQALRLPHVITGPITHAQTALQGWQQRQSAALGCEITLTNALIAPGESQIGRAGGLAPCT